MCFDVSKSALKKAVRVVDGSIEVAVLRRLYGICRGRLGAEKSQFIAGIASIVIHAEQRKNYRINQQSKLYKLFIKRFKNQ